MRLYDILMALFILTIFGLLIGHKSITVQLQGVNDNWPQQRCNPLFMPFADDPIGNFSYCIQKTQKGFMDELLLPINSSFKVINETTSGLTDSMNFVRKFFDYLRNNIINVVSNIYSVFLNLVIEFQRSTIAVKDMVGKMMGTMTSLIYIVDGSIKTAESTWNGPPGKLMRGLCFNRGTLLQRIDGTFDTIKDIELGAVLKDGSEIIGKLVLNNMDLNGNYRESFLKFPHQGENNTDIYVTPYHFIRMPSGEWDYAKYHPHGRASSCKSKQLYCLITSTNTIPVGNLTFYDWEDTPYMHACISKNKR